MNVIIPIFQRYWEDGFSKFEELLKGRTKNGKFFLKRKVIFKFVENIHSNVISELVNVKRVVSPQKSSL